MAFMMPVMKKEYTLYGKQQRRTASETDGTSRKGSHASQASAAQRRRVKSEASSLSTSPLNPSDALSAHVIQNRSKPVGMRRGRGSAPVLAPANQNYVPGASTAPSGNSPAPKFSIVSSPSRSMSSSSSSSGSTTNIGRFHTKLVARIRKSLRLKDPEPTTS